MKKGWRKINENHKCKGEKDMKKAEDFFLFIYFF